MPFECWFLRWMRHYTKSRFGDWFMPRATRLGDYGAVWIALALGMLFFRRTRRPAVQLLVTLAIESLLCNTFLKPFVGRPRPFELSSKVRPLIAPPQGRPFPSGHTASSVAAAASLCLSRCPLWKGALPLALLIAWAPPVRMRPLRDGHPRRRRRGPPLRPRGTGAHEKNRPLTALPLPALRRDFFTPPENRHDEKPVEIRLTGATMSK